MRLIPLLGEVEETDESRRELAEAKQMCEDIIQGYIRDRRPYLTSDIIQTMYDKSCERRKRGLPSDEISRLARLHADKAGWRVRSVDLRSWTKDLHYPTEPAFRIWLQENMPHALEIAVRRPTKGKPGREDTTADIAAYANERKQPGVYWKDICAAWKREHPHDPRGKMLTWQKVREAWRRHYGDKQLERPSPPSPKKDWA